MTTEILNKANELMKNIENLQNAKDYCSKMPKGQICVVAYGDDPYAPHNEMLGEKLRTFLLNEYDATLAKLKAEFASLGTGGEAT